MARWTSAAFVFLFALITSPAMAASITFANTASIAIPDNNATGAQSTISTPAGIWKLIAKDDASGDVGSISGGWEVILDVVGGFVTDVNLRLVGINHTFFADLDIFLQGPDNVILDIVTDNGGGSDAVNLNLTLDDEAASIITALPTTGIQAGNLTYRPETSFQRFDGLAYVEDGGNAVPEPATLTMLGLGALGAVVRRRRGRKA